MTRTKRSPKNGRITYLYTALLYIIGIAFVYISFGIFPLGDKTTLISDMRSQYIDFLSFFKNIPFSTYSFKLGTGNDLLSFFAYYLASPVNLLVFMFRNISVAATAIFTIKLLFAALSCTCWLKNTKVITKNSALELAIPLLSVAYALCGFTTMYSMDIIWFDTVYLFPLLLLSIENTLLYSKKTMPILVALIMITGFYTGIMAIYFSLLYCVFLSFIYKGKVNFFETVYNYFLGASMSAVIFMPTLIRLASNKMTDGNILNSIAGILNTEVNDLFEIALKIWLVVIVVSIVIAVSGIIFGKLKHKFEFFGNSKLNTALFTALGAMILLVNIFFLVTSFRSGAFSDLKYLLPFNYHIETTQIYSGTITYLGIIAGLFCVKSKSFKKHIGLLLLLDICFIPIFSENLDILLHMGQEPISFPYRYTFIITFFMIIASAHGFSCVSLKLCSKVAKYGTAILCTILYCVLAFEIFANALGSFKHNEVHLWGYSQHNHFEEFVEKSADALENIDDDGFYRTEKHFNRNVNDAMQLGYNGITHYSSMYNRQMMYFLEKLGCISTMHFGTYIGHTPLTDTLFGVKYTLGSENTEFLKSHTLSENDNHTYYGDLYEKLYSNDCVDLYKNPHTTGLAFYVDDNIFHTKPNEIPEMSFDLLNVIYNSMLGDTVNPYKRQTVLEQGDNTFSVKSNANGRLFIKSNPGVSHYRVYVNDVAVGSGQYGAFGFVNQNIYGTEVKKGSNTKIVIESDNPLSAGDISVFVEEDTAYNKIMDYLNRNKVDYTVKAEDEIVLNLSGDGGAIFTNIPYDEHWVIESEKDIEITRMLDTFLGLEAPPGDYTITLKYVPTGLSLSCAISGLALVIYLILAFEIFSKKKKRK